MKPFLCPAITASLFLVGLLLLGGCHDDMSNEPDHIAGSGQITTRTVSLPPFSGITLTGIGDVYVKQDSVQSVRLEADDNIIDRLLLDVRGGTLSIGIQPGSYTHASVRIYVSMTSVALLSVTGAGSFAAVGPVQTEALVCRLTGAGSMTLSGIATRQVVELGGTGSIHGFDLQASHCTVTVSGVGTAEVSVTDQLDATITGVGSIVYAGNPPSITQHVTGVGSIRRKS